MSDRIKGAALARQIMGRNFFGIEEAAQHFRLDPSFLRSLAFEDILFSEATLEACKDTHILAAVLPLSILDIRAACSDLFNQLRWYTARPFAADKGEAAWQLIRKTPVDDSTSKTWDEQNTLLGKDEEVPTARALIYTTIGYFRATGKRLFEKAWVRCSDLGSDGYRVYVGGFDVDGLDVYDYADGDRASDLGVSASRKF